MNNVKIAPITADNILISPTMNTSKPREMPNTCPPANPNHPANKKRAKRRAVPPKNKWKTAPINVATINPKVRTGSGMLILCQKWIQCPNECNIDSLIGHVQHRNFNAMKNVIDHAILIPVASDSIWKVISNIEHNPKWHTQCKNVAYLNTIRQQGMRWRSTDKNGREQVLEITAWIGGLGFEYRIVDGVPFSQNVGRIRLQETPDGTIVQWTFSYELSGFIGSLRNSLGVRRNLDTMIVESLRALYRYAKENFKEVEPSSTKSLMQDGLKYEERATYKPRHASALSESKPISEPTSSSEVPLQSVVSFAEPPVAEEDTRPNPAVVTSPTPAEMPSPIPSVTPSTIEPSFLAFVNPEQKQSGSAYTVEENITQEPKNVTQPVPLMSEVLPNPPTPSVVTPSIPPIEPTPSKLPTPAPMPAVVTPTTPPIEPLISEPPSSTQALPVLDKRDTATMSVFDIFGFTRPSATQEMRSVEQPPEPKLAITTAEIDEAFISTVDDASITTTQELERIIPDVNPHIMPRLGLRWLLRRRLASLRFTNWEWGIED